MTPGMIADVARNADLVVVGAGIAGASTAFFAAAAGLEVVVVERGLPGGGASGRTAGYIRCHYANAPEAWFAYDAWQIHVHWKDVVGGDSGFRPVGFLFVVPPALLPPLHRNLAILAGMGIETRFVDARELRDLQPFMETGDAGGAAYEPRSGYADPSDAIGSLLAGVRQRRGRVLAEAGPVRLLAAGSRVTGVRVGGTEIPAAAVLLAAGAETRALAAEVGLDLPVSPMPIGAGLLHGFRAGRAAMCVVDHAAEQWYRGEVGEALVIGAGYEDSIGFRGEPYHGKVTFAPPTREELVAGAARLLPRIPALEHAAPGPTWVGLDSRTPDGHALAGPLPVPGLYVLTGGNGKGFKFGPSMGRALAHVIAGAPFAESPLAPFGPDRFQTGREIRGAHEYAWGSFA
jgi:sarcosine oxidase, subunit beta